MKTLLIDLTPLDNPSRYRGIGRYVRELALGLSELPSSEWAGIDVHGITRLGWTGHLETTRDLASFEGHADIPATSANFSSWADRQRFVLWAAVRRFGADAVHLLEPHARPLLFDLSGARKIVTCYDLIPAKYPDRYLGIGDGGQRIGKWIRGKRFSTADLIVSISDATRKDLVDLFGIPDEKIARVYPGMDLERWTSEPADDPRSVLARFGLEPGNFALYVGGADWRKNVEGMMGGLSKARQRGVKIPLAWAASLEPWRREAALQKAHAAGVADQIVWLGYVDDPTLSVLYRSALAHLFVSRLEGFGLTIVEAMASGCPVIATRGGPLDEVAGDAAISVDPDDHEAIGDALIRLAKDDDLRLRLTAKGRLRAPMFSRAQQALEMVRIYRDFLGIERSGPQ